MNIIYSCFIVLLLSFSIVYFITPLIIKFALRINFVDKPNYRKIHKKATPLMGGIAVFVGFFLVTTIIIVTKIHSYGLPLIGYLLGAVVIVLVGVIDDKRGMSPIVKMLGQALACMLFIYSNNLFTILGPIYITLPILFLWMVGLMNALNFLDNMDGIISGMSGILALGFYAISFISKNPAIIHYADFVALLSLAFAGSVFGFLPYNFNPARIFLGDAGSLFIGYFLGTIGILTGRLAVENMGNRLFYLLPVLMLSYAIFDISLVSYTRKRDGRRVSQGGKDHSTHRIGTAMGSTKITAVIIYLINIIIVLVTILVYEMHSEPLLIFSTILFAAGFLFFGRKLDNIPIIITQNQLRKPQGDTD
ncbi:MAG: undecaprenyl/decaprenyl-phosphate alpha-N-acetylglucosaminyl 1-phosphate transferase [Candidatus Cloacimonetes bacterium]|nr:undecaprenyl/decaprenyl-phosphate alpha-N-acetylglucosaminyl 1-phosphate transferase [Candidatus Cloacimonadota bacterium]